MAQITINIQTLDWTMGETVGLHLMLKIVAHEDVQATQLVVLAQIQRYQVLGSINMQLLQERIGREIQLLVSYLVEVDELQQRILAHVEFLLAIPRISQDT